MNAAEEAGLLMDGKRAPAGRHQPVKCPWASRHSDKTDRAAAILTRGGFMCLHAGCAEFGSMEFLKAARARGGEDKLMAHLLKKRERILARNAAKRGAWA